MLCLAIGFYLKSQDLETMKNKLEMLDQRTKALEKENKDVRDLVTCNISNGASLKKIAFLTFDDGPSDNTTTLLLTLKNTGVKASFFLLGCNIDKYPEITKAIALDGHGVFVHSDTHQYNQIYKSKDTLMNDILTTRKKLWI